MSKPAKPTDQLLRQVERDVSAALNAVLNHAGRKKKKPRSVVPNGNRTPATTQSEFAL